MTYTLVYLEEAKRQISFLPQPAKTLIKSAIENKLLRDPIAFGKPLQYSLKGYRRLRVNDYRVIYGIEPDEKTIVIITIKHRKDVYR